MWRSFYNTILKPRSPDDEKRRHELILKTLLTGVILLTTLSIIVPFISVVIGGSTRLIPSLLVQAGFLALLLCLFIGIQKGYYKAVSLLFIGLLFVLITSGIMRWGILLPHSLLAYSLIIVMVGVLFRAYAAFIASLLITFSLVVLNYLNSISMLSFNESWLAESGAYSDILVYSLIFLVIALVSWLSNREIERSLAQARRSEQALKEERNSLEIKVTERTKELERAQVEKMLEMHRFAEFGRMGSTLLHDIANPLTAISLTLSQPGIDKSQQKLLDQVRKDIRIMERYINGARRQLKNQSETRPFSINREIRRICNLFTTKRKNMQVDIKVEVEKDLYLIGDSIHFNHVISNLLSNALDAYQDTEKPRKPIEITARKKDLAIYIEVKDFGKGIAKDDLTQIFEPFYSTKSSERDSLGIGLAIVKDTIEESFGGRIDVKSTSKSGTSFILTLPLS